MTDDNLVRDNKGNVVGEYDDGVVVDRYPERDPNAPIPESIDDCDFTVRTYNCLKREGVHTVRALAAMTEDQLLDIRNFGQRSVDECKAKLAEFGMRLRPPPKDQIDFAAIVVEHVTHYRFGGLQVTVNGDGSGHVSLRDLSAVEMTGLAAIMERITADQQHQHSYAHTTVADGETCLTCGEAYQTVPD